MHLSQLRRLDATPTVAALLLGTIFSLPASGQLLEQPEEKATAETRRPRATNIIGEWQTDENGEEFRIVRLDKRSRVEGRDYHRLDDETLQGQWGVPIRFFLEDEDYFWIRETRPEERTARTPPAPPAALPDPEPQGTEATWEFDFELRSEGLPTTGQWRNGMDFADMNGDGLLDIVHAPARKTLTEPRIFLQQKDGPWRLWQASFPRISYDYGDAEAGDFNKDGKQDLALAMHLRGSLVLTGDGKGNFERWDEGVAYRSNMNKSVWTGRALASEDLDGDSDLDLVVLGEGMEPPGLREQGTRKISGSKGVVAYLNQGDGNWTSVASPGAAFGDIIEVTGNGPQGRMTIAHSNRTHRDRRVVLTVAADEDGVTLRPSEVTSLHRYSLVDAVDFGDVDSDGEDELITAGLERHNDAWWWTAQWHDRDEDGLWVGHTLLLEKKQSHLFDIAAGDLDGDGLTDIVIGSDEADLFIFKGIGEGNFERVRNTLTRPLVSCGARSVLIEDLDGDGRGELIVGFAGEEVNMPTVKFEGCANQGSLRIWEVVDTRSVESDGS